MSWDVLGASGGKKVGKGKIRCEAAAAAALVREFDKGEKCVPAAARARRIQVQVHPNSPYRWNKSAGQEKEKS